MYFDQRTRAAIRALGLDTAETTQTSEPTADAVAAESTLSEPAVGSTFGAMAYDRACPAHGREEP
ncbi:hypothetical protein [Natronomonas sp. LN261]|jgi:hypothetical protein|uniref:hypothetical protein n=1 Tax=Natronomonas sp. LN261 TaxID=2750669 RepID=UPI0015EE5789|nr:hypothetical protein [Natronomonas sp. LN261]